MNERYFKKYIWVSYQTGDFFGIFLRFFSLTAGCVLKIFQRMMTNKPSQSRGINHTVHIFTHGVSLFDRKGFRVKQIVSRPIKRKLLKVNFLKHVKHSLIVKGSLI